jgi:hypothetical protein
VLSTNPHLIQTLNVLTVHDGVTIRHAWGEQSKEDSAELLLVSTDFGGRVIPLSPASEKAQPAVTDTESLQSLLQSTPDGWSALLSMSSSWASCVLELLQLEYVRFLHISRFQISPDSIVELK